MLTNTLSLDRQIEELRAELRVVVRKGEARRIRVELDHLLRLREERDRKADSGG